MATTLPPIWELLAAAAFLFAVLLVGYYTLVRLRNRRRTLSLELDTARDLVEDRAHNQLRLARAEAALLTREGIDIGKAGDLLREAEDAITRRRFDTGLAYARSAHENFVKLRQSSATSTGGQTGAAEPSAVPLPPFIDAAPPAGPLGPAGTGPTPVVSDGPLPEAPRRTALPRNKAESRFQLSLLAEEIGRAADSPPADMGVAEATEMRRRAEEASARGDYTEALRLALRGRRRLGSRLETLPAPPAAAAPSSAQSTPVSGEPAPSEGDESLVCRSCGEPLRGNDRFCRFCGTLRGPPRCSGCGAEITSDDRFCAACGRPLRGTVG